MCHGYAPFVSTMPFFQMPCLFIFFQIHNLKPNRFDEVNVELEPYHSEEGADQTERSKHRNKDVDLFVLFFREEWILTLDSTSLHLAVPAL